MTSKAVIAVPQTVLVGDRESSICKLLRSALVKAGYHVHGAAEPEDALRLCRTEHIDLVLADVGWAPATGHELARSVATQYPCIRVVLMAAWGSECDCCPYRSQCKVISKPFGMDEALVAVRDALAAAPPGRN